MDALREYYEYVFLLDDLLEVILGDKLVDQFNLRGAYSDVLLVSNQDSIQLLQDKPMLKSEHSYEQFMFQIEQILAEKNNLGFKFHFKGEFFRQNKLTYLYNLIGEDYFCMLMKYFHFYRLDGLFNCYLQFGRQIVEDNKLPMIKRNVVDEKRMSLPGNHSFCKANGEAMGALVRSSKQANKFGDNNQEKILKELKNLHGFLDEVGGSVIRLLMDKAKKVELSHLRSPKLTIKLQLYTCDFVDDRLDRERIYENSNLLETKERFQRQFDAVDAEALLDQIFQGDQEVKSTFKRQHSLRKEVLDCLNAFIIGHKSCDFSSLLKDTCPVPEFVDDLAPNECYEPSDHLFDFTKQDQVSNYMRSVLHSVLPPELLGAENFKGVCHWFNLIPFQNSNIEQYFSNFHYKFDLKEVGWLRNQSATFKLHTTHRLIMWLSDYVLELLRFSFYTVKDLRLRFYRFDYWMKIKSKQLSDWARLDKIETNRYENVMEDPQDLPLDLDYDMKPLFDFIQIHSTVPAGSTELTRRFKCVGTVLKAICNDQANVFKSEIEFYNRVKAFFLNKRNQHEFSYFKLEFEDQLPNINQDLLLRILGERLASFYAKYGVEKIQIKQAAIFNKVRWMKKEEVHYVNLNGLEMIENLRLSGCWDLSNSLVNELDVQSVYLSKETVYELAFKFIKQHRLRVSATDYLAMKDGLSFNEHLTRQLLTLYTNDLVEKSIPNLAESDDVLICCEDNQLIVFTISEEDARKHFNSIIRNMEHYKLNSKIRHSHIHNVRSLEDIARKMTSECKFGQFKLCLEAHRPSIFQYKNPLFDVKNIKSSFSFHLWEHPEQFKTLLIQSFFDNFRFFNFDQSVRHFEMVLMNLFNHFSVFAVQVLFFFENTLLLSRDENPKLIFEFIFDLLYNFVQQLKYQDKLMPNFKIDVDFFTLLWLLVRTFRITWNTLKRSRRIENEMLQQLEQWTKPYLKNLDELSSFDLEHTWSDNMKKIDFCINKGREPKRLD